MFVPPPVSFFVVLFLFVLVFLYVLFSVFSFVLRFGQFLLGLLLRPHAMVLDIVEGQGRGGPFFDNGVKPDIIQYAALKVLGPEEQVIRALLEVSLQYAGGSEEAHCATAIFSSPSWQHARKFWWSSRALQGQRSMPARSTGTLRHWQSRFWNARVFIERTEKLLFKLKAEGVVEIHHRQRFRVGSFPSPIRVGRRTLGETNLRRSHDCAKILSPTQWKMRGWLKRCNIVGQHSGRRKIGNSDCGGSSPVAGVDSTPFDVEQSDLRHTCVQRRNSLCGLLGIGVGEASNPGPSTGQRREVESSDDEPHCGRPRRRFNQSQGRCQQ